jgi:4-hydroxythreonine-4-phosphate dehydrogenase
MTNGDKTEKIIYGITQGDPNGVGMELILRIFSDEHIFKYGTPVLYGSPKTFSFYKKMLGLEDIRYHLIESAKDAQEGKLNLVVGSSDELQINPGESSEAAGKEALNCLNKALEDSNHIKALVTAPLDKQTVAHHQTGFSGHTGHIANYFGVDNYAMFLVSDELKVALATEHFPVSQVAENLNQSTITNKLEVIYNSLREDLNIIKPRIAVLGLNPHAGDNGLLGKEESEIIKPAVDQAFEKGKLVYGPYSADSFFGSGNYKSFDAVLAMYHDQGLIPFKSMAFYDGVNFTAGLPIIRTSPDHGTAYDLAGKGTAETLSMRNAIHDSIHFVKNRLQFIEDFSNPLPYTEFRRERFRIEF